MSFFLTNHNFKNYDFAIGGASFLRLAFLPYIVFIFYSFLFYKTRRFITLILTFIIYFLSGFIVMTTYLNFVFFIFHGLILIPTVIFAFNKEKLDIKYIPVLICSTIAMGVVNIICIYFSEYIYYLLNMNTRVDYTKFVTLQVFFWQLYVGILLDLIFVQKHKWFVQQTQEVEN
jgi:hypothetical protein